MVVSPVCRWRAGHLDSGRFLPAGEETKHAQGDAYPTLTSSSIEDLAASFRRLFGQTPGSAHPFSARRELLQKDFLAVVETDGVAISERAGRVRSPALHSDGDHLLGVSLVPSVTGLAQGAGARDAEAL